MIDLIGKFAFNNLVRGYESGALERMPLDELSAI